MYRIRLSEEQRLELKRRARSRATVPRTRDRLEMVRLGDGGLSVPQIARLVHISEEQVRYWVKRFLAGGFDALPDAPHLGQRRSRSRGGGSCAAEASDKERLAFRQDESPPGSVRDRTSFDRLPPKCSQLHSERADA